MELMRVKENQIFGTSEEYAVPTLRVVIAHEDAEDEVIEVPYYTGSFKNISSAKKLNTRAKRLAKERLIWKDEYRELQDLANEARKEYEEIIAKEAEEERIAKEKAEAAEAVRIASKEAKEEFVNAKKDAKKAYKDKLASIKGVKEETLEAEEVNPDQLSDEELTELALAAVNPETLEDETVDDQEVELLEEPEQIVIDKETKKFKKIKVDKKAFVLGGALAAVGIIWLVSRQSCKLNNAKNALKDAALDKNSTNIETSVKNIPEVSINKDEDSYYVETAAPTEEEKEAFVEDSINYELSYDEIIDNTAQLDKDVDAALASNEGIKSIDAEQAMALYVGTNIANTSEEVDNALVENNMLPDDKMIFMDNYFSGADAAREVNIDAMLDKNRQMIDMTKYVADPDSKAQVEAFQAMMRTVRDLPESHTKEAESEEVKKEVDNIITQLQNYYLNLNTTDIKNVNVTPVGLTKTIDYTMTQAIVRALGSKQLISQETALWFDGTHIDPATGEEIDNTSINELATFMDALDKHFTCYTKTR